MESNSRSPERKEDGSANRLEARHEGNGALSPEPPSPVPPSSRTDLMPPMLTPRTTVGRIDDEAAGGSKVPPPPWEIDGHTPPQRRGWLIGAVAAAAVVVLGLAVNGLRNDGSTGATAGDPVAVASVAGSAKDAGTSGDASAEAGTTRSDAASSNDAGKSAAPEDGAGKGAPDHPAGSSQAAGETEAPAAGTTAAGAKKTGAPLKPAFEVINFLGDDEKPKYTAAQMPAGATWDDKTKQVTASSLKNCLWIDKKQRPFKSKGGKLFRYIHCKAGSGELEGWVVQAGMKS